MQYVTVVNAGENERFAEGAFEDQIGKEFTGATLVKAELIDDDRSVELTFEIPDDHEFTKVLKDRAIDGLSAGE